MSVTEFNTKILEAFVIERKINLFCWWSSTLWGMFVQIINWKLCKISLLRKLVSKKLVSECNVCNMEFPFVILRISTHARNFCSITLWCTTFDQYFNIGSIPHGDSEFFLCPTLVTRRKKHFSLFQYWSCYTTNVLQQQRKKNIVTV